MERQVEEAGQCEQSQIGFAVDATDVGDRLELDRVPRTGPTAGRST
jgi:hypothetical protein